MTANTIILIGFMGTGKSSCAKELAKLSGLCCIDTDEEIVRRTGKRIAEIFREEGESAFRELEQAVIKDLADRKDSRQDIADYSEQPVFPAVIAVGGGAVLSEVNRRHLRALGTVVYLRAEPETIREHLCEQGAIGERPLLNGADSIASLMEKRNTYYETLADLTVDVDGKDPAAVAKEIQDAGTFFSR